MSHTKQDLMDLATTVLDNESGSSDRYELAEFIMTLPVYGTDQSKVNELFDRLSGNVRPTPTRRSRRQTKTVAATVPTVQFVQAHIAAMFIPGLAAGTRVSEDMVANAVANINEPALAKLIDVVLAKLRIYSGHVDFLCAMGRLYEDRNQWFGGQPDAIRKIIHRYRKQLCQLWNGEHAGRSH